MNRIRAVLACCLPLWPGSALAADTVAVFPFELLDSSQEGELILKVRPEETKRLELLTQDLMTRLSAAMRACADHGGDPRWRRS